MSAVSPEAQRERGPSFRRSLPLQFGSHVGMGAIGMDMGHHGQHPHMVKGGAVEISMYSLSVS